MKNKITNDLLKVSEVELIYRSKFKASDRPSITNSQEAYGILRNAWSMDKIELLEEFKILILDRKNKCLAVSTISSGGFSACLVDLKLAFATALKARGTSMILAHNHPSGNCVSSAEDKSLTTRFVSVGKALDLPIRDHIIVTKDGYSSMADDGFLGLI